jgi:hypothetical protein
MNSTLNDRATFPQANMFSIPASTIPVIVPDRREIEVQTDDIPKHSPLRKTLTPSEKSIKKA